MKNVIQQYMNLNTSGMILFTGSSGGWSAVLEFTSFLFNIQQFNIQ